MIIYIYDYIIFITHILNVYVILHLYNIIKYIIYQYNKNVIIIFRLFINLL